MAPLRQHMQLENPAPDTGFAAVLNDEELQISKQLSAGKRAIRRLHFQISSTMLLLVLCSTGGIITFRPILQQNDFVCCTDFHCHVSSALRCFVIFLGFAALGMTPLPSQLRLTQAVLVAFIIGKTWASYRLVVLLIEMTTERDDSVSCITAVGEERHQLYFRLLPWSIVPCLVSYSVGAIMCLLAFFFATAEKMQEFFWRVIAWECLVSSFGLIIWLVIVGIACGILDKHVWFVCFWYAPFAYVARSRSFRRGVHFKVAKLYSDYQATAASAGIAGLVGNCSVSEVLTQAKTGFRCVNVSDMKSDMFLPCSIEADSAVESQQTRLGDCDAFVSHSWSDDAATKWHALVDWTSCFSEAAGREPLIWLDKCCIDQSDIEKDLRGLPVFLSGSKQLVMLVGLTYMTRLWCILEVFTFVHMGGNPDRMIFVPLLRKGHEMEDRLSILQSCQSFDVRKCDCSNPKDKETILHVIYCAFGSFEQFNAAVRKIFDAANMDDGSLTKEQCMAESEMDLVVLRGEAESNV